MAKKQVCGYVDEHVKERIEDTLSTGESMSQWVNEAIFTKLDREEGE